MFKIRNMTSPNTGKPVVNQFMVATDDGTYFFSYSSLIAFYSLKDDVTYIDPLWRFSKTTVRWLKDYLGINSTIEISEGFTVGTYREKRLNEEGHYDSAIFKS